MTSIYILAILVLVQNTDFIIHRQSDPAAKCLDGSPPALYFQEGTQKDKFVVYF